MTATTRLLVVVTTLGAALIGWGVAGRTGGVAALVAAVALGVPRRRGRPACSWLLLWVRRNAPIVLRAPITATNDRSGGGVRHQDGVVAVAVQLLGKPHVPTLFTSTGVPDSGNTVDVVTLLPLLRQSLGLSIASLSVVSAGARRRRTGDYPRVYDTLIGTPPYAGRRETWLIARIPVQGNAEALRHRRSVGAAAVAAAQRICTAMRQNGIRARVATATDIVEMERRLGLAVSGPGNRRWHSVRGAGGWLTSYGYPPGVTAEALAQAWSLRADRIVHNVTLFADGSVSATVTVGSAQPPAAPPSVLLQALPGEQALALAACCVAPLPDLRGVRRTAAPGRLDIPLGPSGVLLGKSGTGERLLLPLDDPGEYSRVHLAADDALVQRIVVRLAACGERVTVHTGDPNRWAGVRMADVVVTSEVRPAAATTISIVDGTLIPAPRPNTVISVGDPGVAQHGAVDVLLTQTGPATLTVTSGGQVYPVEMELFRVEDRYVSRVER